MKEVFLLLLYVDTRRRPFRPKRLYVLFLLFVPFFISRSVPSPSPLDYRSWSGLDRSHRRTVVGDRRGV